QMSVRGPDYDGRTTAEARELVHQAKTAFPELARDKGEFLERQLYSINVQQAEKDLSIAEFYRRTGHPGSAYFYYELVRRRYPGTTYATHAQQRKQELRSKAEKDQGTGPPPQPQPERDPRPNLLPGMPVGPSVPPPGIVPV